MTFDHSSGDKGPTIARDSGQAHGGHPGSVHALTAVQIEQAGFDAVYVSGAAVSAARGLPDIGLISLTEMVGEAGLIARAVAIPTIVDADTGYGPPSTVMNAVREFERAGIAGMQIEDQEAAKMWSSRGQTPHPLGDMVAKINAAVKARHNRNFLIVARTDARTVDGLMARSNGPGLCRGRRRYVVPGSAVITGGVWNLSPAIRNAGISADCEHDGVRPNALSQRGRVPSPGLSGSAVSRQHFTVAARAVEKLLSELKFFGSQRNWLDHMMTRQELYDLIRPRGWHHIHAEVT